MRKQKSVRMWGVFDSHDKLHLVYYSKFFAEVRMMFYEPNGKVRPVIVSWSEEGEDGKRVAKGRIPSREGI